MVLHSGGGALVPKASHIGGLSVYPGRPSLHLPQGTQPLWNTKQFRVWLLRGSAGCEP